MAVARAGITQESVWTYKVFEVELLSSKELRVTGLESVAKQFGRLEVKNIRTIKLNTIVFDKLAQMSLHLKNAEIRNSISPIVCEIYVQPAAFFDDLKVLRSSNIDKEELETVLSPQGCWVYKSSRAKNVYDYRLSVVLKESLINLGIQLLEE